MIPIPVIELPTSFLAPLASAAVRILALAGVAAGGLFVFRAKSTFARLVTWTAVLYGALAMPLLQQLLPPLPLNLPAFLRTSAGQASANSTRFVPRLATASRAVDSTAHQSTSAPARAIEALATPVSSKASGPRWNQIAAGLYLSGVCFLLARLVIGLSFAKRLRSASRVIRDARIAEILAGHARASGISFLPEAAESEHISVPLAMGILRPVILFPMSWREWDDAKLDAVIAHEMSHIARRDALTQRISLLHCIFFWFSPLAWWLDRHLAELVEQASDEAALAGGADSQAYAATLLSFFKALQGTPQRVWWQGVSMASAGRAEQRVERILAWKGSVAMSLKKSIAVLVAVLAVPAVYLAAAARPSDHDAKAQSVTLIRVAQDKTSASAVTPARAGRSGRKSSQRSSYSYGYGDDFSYALVSGKSESLTMSGNGFDDEHVQELRKTIPGDFLWFRREGKSYLVRDQATIDRAKALWAPQEELGKQQEELGKQQELLGKQQEELGQQMEKVQVKVPDLTKEMERLQAQVKQLNAGATSEQIADLQSLIGDLQEKIGESQSQAGDQQSKLGDQMSALGDKQGELGERQGELGRRQGELAEQASRKMKSLLDESVSKGLAQPEK